MRYETGNQDAVPQGTFWMLVFFLAMAALETALLVFHLEYGIAFTDMAALAAGFYWVWKTPEKRKVVSFGRESYVLGPDGNRRAALALGANWVILSLPGAVYAWPYLVLGVKDDQALNFLWPLPGLIVGWLIWTTAGSQSSARFRKPRVPPEPLTPEAARLLEKITGKPVETRDPRESGPEGNTNIQVSREPDRLALFLSRISGLAMTVVPPVIAVLILVNFQQHLDNYLLLMAGVMASMAAIGPAIMRGMKEGHVALIFGAIMVSGPCIDALYGLHAISESAKVDKWPVTVGTVIESKTFTGGRSLNNRYETTHVRVVYRYQVHGKRFENDRLWLYDVSLKKWAAESFARMYHPGQQVRVFYDPMNPARAALAPGLPYLPERKEDVETNLMAAGFFVLMTAIFILLMRAIHKERWSRPIQSGLSVGFIMIFQVLFLGKMAGILLRL